MRYVLIIGQSSDVPWAAFMATRANNCAFDRLNSICTKIMASLFQLLACERVLVANLVHIKSNQLSGLHIQQMFSLHTKKSYIIHFHDSQYCKMIMKIQLVALN